MTDLDRAAHLKIVARIPAEGNPTLPDPDGDLRKRVGMHPGYGELFIESIVEIMVGYDCRHFERIAAATEAG